MRAPGLHGQLAGGCRPGALTRRLRITPFLLLKAFDTRLPGLPRAATRPFLCLRRIAAMRGLGGLVLARAKRISTAAPKPPQRPQAYAWSSARLPHEGGKLRNQARRARRLLAHHPGRAERDC